MDKYIGKMLDDRYEILEIIGVGGMAVVYKAMCHRLNRLVAVKILKDEFLLDEELRRRFQAESQAVAKLSHANIVSVFDVSTHGNMDYIVMELIDGITLKKHLQMLGCLSWRETVHFTSQIAKALEHAHSRGVIHRDIKPQNIMLLHDGSVKVADFGIARMVSAQNTLTREALGSVHYISPEQAKGARMDNRTDLYSLGVVMYEMLTGQLPFQGETPVAVAIQHISATPRMPRELNPNIPIGLEQITMKAMCANLADRYASATELLADLEAFRENPDIIFPYGDYAQHLEYPQEEYEPEPEIVLPPEPILPPERRRKRPTRIPMAAGLVFLAALVALLLWASYHFLLSDLLNAEVPLTVPSLVGKDYDTLNLDDYSQFILEVTTIQPNDYYDPGMILNQEPKAGATIRPSDNRISLTISGEVPTGTMPYLINLSNSDAKERLTSMQLDLIIRTVAEYSSFVEDQVIRTEPEAGTALRAGDTVTLVVSLGAESDFRKVPELLNLTLDEAKRALKEAGLTVGVVREQESDITKGLVIRQEIESGDTVRAGTAVNLILSSGRKESNKPDETPGQDKNPDETTTERNPVNEEQPTQSGQQQEDVPVAGEPVEPVLVTRIETIRLPEGEGTFLLTIKVDGTTVFDMPVDMERGSIEYQLEGVGTKQMDIYFDGVLQESRTLVFTS